MTEVETNTNTLIVLQFTNIKRDNGISGICMSEKYILFQIK